MIRRPVLSLVVTSGVILAASAAPAATIPDLYSSFWVLGDSLSDDGNAFAASGGTTPASPPYFEGRFSNGPVWADYAIDAFEAAEKPAANLAFGGARAVTNGDLSPDLPAQAALFAPVSAGRLGARPLAALFFGGNDLFAAAAGADPEGAARAAADAVAEGARALSAFGVEDFLVFSAPDVSDTPRIDVFQSDRIAAAASAVTAFNMRLAQNLASLEATGLAVNRFDVEMFLSDFLGATPEITEAELPCLFPSDAAAATFDRDRLCADPGNYLFFDSVHPTAAAHLALFEDVETQLVAANLAPVPAPIALPMLASALGLLGFFGRRRVG